MFIDGAQDAVDYKAGEGWREGISLREAVFLDKKIKGTIGSVEKTFVGALVHEIKVVHESVETRVGFEDIKGFLPRHLIPAVDQVNKNACSVWGEVGGQGLGDKGIQLAVCCVDKKIETAADSQAKLARRK